MSKKQTCNRFQFYGLPQVLKPKGQNIKGKKGGGKPGPIPMSSLQQKHPVSLLGELASKRRWGAPNYELVNEHGPAHAKSFLFKVRTTGKCFPGNFFTAAFLVCSTGSPEWNRLYLQQHSEQQKRGQVIGC